LAQTVERVRWGVLGPGTVATRAVIPAIQASATGRVVAVASRDPARAAAVAAALAIPRAHTGYAALLADPEVEAVYLALPNHLHRPWTLAAAHAGKHVLCEKPLALNAAEASEMAAACRAAGRLLMEAAMYRFHPRLLRLKELVAGGALGAIRLIHAAFTFPLTARDNYRLRPEMGGGALLDVGLYSVGATRWLAGREPVAVQAVAEAWAPHGIDRQLAGLLDFGEGCFATVQCSFGAAEHQVIEIIGTVGVARAPRAFTAWREEPAPLYWRGADGEERTETFEADPYALMVTHFDGCVRGQANPLHDAQDAIATLAILDALARAGQTADAQKP
jgi:D-xylose 1-dehydrogenase (NADP+, D-xylono-1,5-lactone-forming)